VGDWLSLFGKALAVPEAGVTMSNSRRDRFLKRISTVGGGTREDIQMMLGGIVFDLRDQIERGMFAEEEMETVVSFHDRVEEFWRHTIVSNPPMEPLLMVAGLRQLSESCTGPVVGFRPRLDQAVKKAKAFADAREYDSKQK
jgi:hypothetical protein